VTFWWEKALVLSNTQEEGLEAGLVIYITTHQKHSGIRMNGLSIDAAVNFELGQVLKDSSLAESVLGRRTRSGAIRAESRSFCSS
jgi:hypothetical protein